MKKYLSSIHLFLIVSIVMGMAACQPVQVISTPTTAATSEQVPTDSPTAEVEAEVEDVGPVYLDSSRPVNERVEDLLARMTLQEKVGQMTQVEKNSIEADDITELSIGSILSGGGGYPSRNTPEAWAEMVDEFQDYALNSRLGIPLIYGVDAVHGHNNVIGATIFPHNIGLGATGDADLVERIGRATAEEMAGTGIRWNFAPVVAVVQDIRWGRTYEGYGEVTDLVTELGTAYIEGLQAGSDGSGIGDPLAALATPKHYIGDGGTTWGSSTTGNYMIDQGDLQVDEETLRRLYLPPYEQAIESGAMSIMVSFSSWNGIKMHAEQYLLTDVLKGELGFEGFIVSDWQAIDQIPGDYYSDVVTSINAGLDMVMVPYDYMAFIRNLTKAVEDGDIPQERIDDAVRRILRVKFEMGLFEQPYSDPEFLAQVGSDEHRELAREAVAKSLVLLKNDNQALPIPKDSSLVLVAGDMAESIGDQLGGWSIEWQGRSGNITEGTTIVGAVRGAVGDETSVEYNRFGKFERVLGVDGNPAIADIGIVVVGETPYAEGVGDRDDLSLSGPQIEMIRRMREQSEKLVVVILSGRPMIITDQLAFADAWVAAWLPGTEAQGITDVLFGDLPFTGKLAYTWPRSMDQLPFDYGNMPSSGCDAPLFPFGYGLDTDSEPVEILNCQIPSTASEPAAEAGEGDDRVLVIDDFEGANIIQGADGSALVGFYTWSDGSAVSISSLEVAPGDDLTVPETEQANTVIQLATEIDSGGWAGFTHGFSSENLDQWVTQDWSSYVGFALWLYGNETGGTLYVDILENRNPDSSGDDAERWTYTILDDFTGWQYIQIPFEDFSRKDISNGAPNDGFSLEEVHGYAVGAYGSIPMGAQTNYVDQVVLYGQAPEKPLQVGFTRAEYSVRENGKVKIRVTLNKASDSPVKVSMLTAESTATAGKDYVMTGDELIFEPGQTEMTVEIRAEDDHQVEGNEKVALILTNIDGAEPAFQRRAILTIRDNDYQDDSVLSNFNSLPPWITNGAVELGIVDLAADDEMALPDQTEVEAVLSLSVGQADQPASVDRIYASPQDWSLYDGIRFWMYGTGSGAEMTFEVYDNEGSNTGDAAPGSWELVWSDEFDGPAGTPPNPAVWKAELGDGTLNGNPGWGNNELEAYTDQPENASMDGKGNLVITARKTDPAASNQVCWYGPCEYTSARLITQDTVEFAYGRVEARLKLPKGQGIWPAFWMLGDDLGEVGWPQSGEIDIMENIGREPNIVHGTVHGPGYSGGNGIGGGYEFEGKLPSDEFHVYAVEWTPNKIRWMIDDQEFFSVTPDDLPEGAAWVYDHPFFLILNLAVGGNWPGNPDASTVFPQSLLVDYVRVYGTKSSAERYLATKTDDFVGWHLVELPFNEFTRSDTQPAGAPNDGLDLDAVSGYQMHFSPGAQREYYLEDYHLFQR